MDITVEEETYTTSVAPSGARAARRVAASRARGRGCLRTMLMGLLYEQAQARPEHPALVYRDERIASRELVERIERLAARPRRARASAPATRSALRARRRPVVRRQLPRDHRARRRGRAGQPRLQAGRARVLLPQRGRHARSSATSAPPASASGSSPAWTAGRGDHDQRRARPGAARSSAARGRLRRSGCAPRVAGRAVRLPVLLGLDRPAQARGAHPRAVRRRGRTVQRRSGSAPRTGSSARSRCSTRGAWAPACSRRRRPARRS